MITSGKFLDLILLGFTESGKTCVFDVVNKSRVRVGADQMVWLLAALCVFPPPSRRCLMPDAWRR